MTDLFQSLEKLPINDKNVRYGEGGKRLDKNKSKKNQNLLISIITVVYNGEKYLEETFESVFNQTYKNEDKIDYWVSENDKGIYDSFNKGMKLCQGDYIGFINSDDTYEKNALEILVKYINQNLNADFFFGSVKKHWGILHGYKPWKIFYSWGFYSSHSTGFFIKTESAKKVGFYNLNYKHSADYDYFFRMIVKKKLKGVGTKKDELFGVFRRGGFSSKINFFDHFLEEIKIRLNNKQNKFLVLLIFIYKYIKHIKKI